VLARAAVTPRLRLDLEGVRFADAGTVARVCSIAAALPAGGHLVLARVPDVVRRILETTGLGHHRLRVES
jgi:anti-anti-sigma regulatory factor